MELEDKHDDSMESIAASQPSQVSSGDAPLAKRPAIADVISLVGSAGRASPSTGVRALIDAPVGWTLPVALPLLPDSR